MPAQKHAIVDARHAGFWIILQRKVDNKLATVF
jgi:hypothetical protein